MKKLSITTTYFLTIFLFTILFSACQKEVIVENNESELNNLALNIIKPDKITTSSTCFSAIAQVSSCAEEWIRFSGWIEIKENVTVDGSGKTHITRHFTVKDVTGVGVSVRSTIPTMTCNATLNGTLTGTTYEVLGGAEMFSIHFGEGQNATLSGSNTFMHRGTLVFRNTETGQRVIAKHVIRKVNGVVKENIWECSGNEIDSFSPVIR